MISIILIILYEQDVKFLFPLTNPEGRNKNTLHLIQIHNLINYANQNRKWGILDNMHATTKDIVLNETLPKSKTGKCTLW